MGCGSCGCSTGESGKPNGCQSNGGCSTGGCNRMNVFNWLSDIPISDLGRPYPIIEVSFNNGSRKDFFKNEDFIYLEKGIFITVEGSSGIDVGQVNLTGELVKLQMKKYGVSENPEMKKVLRLATEHDIELFQNAKAKEKEILVQSRAIAKTLNLEMKIAEAEVQADSKKICFFYTADARVDFRELIKVFATEFKAKIEMRQIGARQESSKVGGIGSCGRELCCSSWLSDFKTVNTTTARYQNLSINQAKLSGQCGRLKCCLNFELDSYMDALKIFPENADHLELTNGRAYLIKKDIFRNLIWYGMSGSSRQYPVSLEKVTEILALNAKGEKAAELEVAEVANIKSNNQKPIDVGFINDVGQISLNSLNKSSNKKKKGSAPAHEKGANNNPNRTQGSKPNHQAKGNNNPEQSNRLHKGNTENEERKGDRNKPNVQKNNNNTHANKEQQKKPNKPNPNATSAESGTAAPRGPKPPRNNQNNGENPQRNQQPKQAPKETNTEATVNNSNTKPKPKFNPKRNKPRPEQNKPNTGVPAPETKA